jgi:hypothetical protein
MPLPPGNHPGGNLAAFFDGSVRFLSKSIDPQTVHRLATPADGQAVPLDY